MSDLRKAAEMVIEAHDEGYGKIAHDLAIEELRQALAESEQKPLVWMNKYGHVASFQNEEYKDPLYTAPPKREWVGLTDVEIMGMTCECVDDGTFNMDCARDFANRIEAKLKEKNHALR